MADEEWLVDGPKTIDLAGIDHLKVGLIAGQVDIVGHDEPETRVEVHSVSGRDLRIAVQGGRLEIDHPQLRWDNWLETMRAFRASARADVSVLVPRAVALKLGVVTASALLTGTRGDASLSTVSGDLVVDAVQGDLQLNSVSGEIAVRDHEGRVVVHTVSGDVTASGRLTNFSSDGVSADVFLDLTGPGGAVAVNSVSGSVTARIEGEAPVDYAVSTASGKLQLDGDRATVVRGRYLGSSGPADGERLDFKVNTVSGDVNVLHRVPA
jgi:DUF4097 and DUF4098 domain-containing protein YvlB